MKSILVQWSAQSWTTQALHLACALAGSNQADVVLLHLIPVSQVGLLGTEFYSVPFSYPERKALKAFDVISENYQVRLTVETLQYVTLLGAVEQAAELLDAEVVFADVPKSWLPYWQRFRIWTLDHHLHAQHRQLYTLTNWDAKQDGVPFISSTPTKSAAPR